MLLQEGSGLSLRAQHTLHNSLNAQLSLLSSCVPAVGWLVCERQGANFSVVAYDGNWCFRTRSDYASQFMFGSWRLLPGQANFQHRELTQSDLPAWYKINRNHAIANCFIRYPLRDLDSGVCAWLLGAFNNGTSNNGSCVVSPVLAATNTHHILTTMALSISLFADFKRADKQLTRTRHDALTDPLTGVLNRAGWEAQIQVLEEANINTVSEVAVVILDLDFLKLVNDLHGHSAGDNLLRLTADALRSITRKGDILARIGGDEFGIMAPISNTNYAKPFAERLSIALNNAKVKGSTGMAFLSETGTIRETIALADKRMYHNKRSKSLPERYAQ